MRKSSMCMALSVEEEVICVLGTDETRNNKQTNKKKLIRS